MGAAPGTQRSLLVGVTPSEIAGAHSGSSLAENDPAPFRKAAGHSCSSPSLLDQSDRGACTLPPGMRPQVGAVLCNTGSWGLGASLCLAGHEMSLCARRRQG